MEIGPAISKLGRGTHLLLILLAIVARADVITGDPVGLPGATSVISFDELGDLSGQAITNQFAPLGATFSGLTWENMDLGQVGATGFSGPFLVNLLATPFDPISISFSVLLSGVAFAALDQGHNYSIAAFLGGASGTLVKQFTVNIPMLDLPSNAGIGFIGFDNLTFDAITIAPETLADVSQFSLDTLQIKVSDVPEPSSFVLLGTCTALIALWLRRCGDS